MAQKKFELADYANLVNITDSQILPDGKSVVIVVSKPDYVQNRFNAELVLADAASGNKRVLTQDRFAVLSPRWSPNGEQLAFALGFDKTIGTIEVGKAADVWVIDGDPSKNISDIRKVQYVFKYGVGYNSKKLFESVKGNVGFN